MTITHGRLTDSDLRLFPKQGQAKKGTKASEMKLGVVSQRRDFDDDFRSDCPTVRLAGRGVEAEDLISTGVSVREVESECSSFDTIKCSC